MLLEAEGGRGMGKADGSYIQIQIYVIKMTEPNALDCDFLNFFLLKSTVIYIYKTDLSSH